MLSRTILTVISACIMMAQCCASDMDIMLSGRSDKQHHAIQFWSTSHPTQHAAIDDDYVGFGISFGIEKTDLRRFRYMGGTLWMHPTCHLLTSMTLKIGTMSIHDHLSRTTHIPGKHCTIHGRGHGRGHGRPWCRGRSHPHFPSFTMFHHNDDWESDGVDGEISQDVHLRIARSDDIADLHLDVSWALGTFRSQIGGGMTLRVGNDLPRSPESNTYPNYPAHDSYYYGFISAGVRHVFRDDMMDVHDDQVSRFAMGITIYRGSIRLSLGREWEWIDLSGPGFPAFIGTLSIDL